jgi:hypothetical protein
VCIRWKKLFLTALLTVLAFYAMGSGTDADEGGGERMKEKSGKKLTVSGKVRVTGSMPYTELVIGEGGDVWFVGENERDKLSRYMGKTITVTGKAFYIEMVLANGKKAGIKRVLKDIKIVE